MFKPKISTAPHVPRIRALLDSREMVRNPIEVFERYRARLGPSFTLHFGGVKPSLVTADPMVVEHVLKGHASNYRKSHIQVEHMVEFQGMGLVNSHGDAWLRQRRLLAQGFKPNHLTKLLPVQQSVLGELMSEFDRSARQGPVDVHHQMVRFTLRLVGRSLFGRSMSDEELEQIGATISEIQSYIFRQIVQPYGIPWFRLRGLAGKYQKMRREGDAIVLRHIRARLNQGTGETDFLRVLRETPYQDTGEPMSESQVLIESLQLMVAGNETSSNALTWIFYLLARHPEYIEEIRNEIEAVIGDDEIDFRKLHQLDATMRVIDEALRLFPPFWAIDRVALDDDEVGGIRIPAGTMVIPYIYGVHRNPAYWEDAEAFDPSRFSRERCKARHPFAHIPFGGGPRTCIGSNMAIVQILLIIMSFVRRYDFALTSPAPIAMRPMMLLRPGGEVMMSFRPTDSRSHVLREHNPRADNAGAPKRCPYHAEMMGAVPSGI